MPEIDLTILMPCLNEAETLAACIEKAKHGIESCGIPGEIVIADNGSTDGSVKIAGDLGARVVAVAAKGYGSALRGGIEAAHGKWIIMGDADDSYDFSNIRGMVGKLQQGCDVVMGCRLPSGGGTILPGAMPWKNRWIGNPSLSFIGRLLFRIKARDFHCGLRGFTRAAYDGMELITTGMEFASEMVIKASLKGLRVDEVPITLHPDGRSRPPHLRPWRDGWRHLRFMFLFSPKWLFFVPGLLLCLAGCAGGAALFAVPLHFAGIQFDVGTLTVACMLEIVGIQLVALACFTKVFTIAEGLLPEDPGFSKVFKVFTLEKGILLGTLVLLIGVALLCEALLVWGKAAYGLIPYSENMRRLVPAVTLIVIGIQIISSSFFMSVLGLKTAKRKPPEGS